MWTKYWALSACSVLKLYNNSVYYAINRIIPITLTPHSDILHNTPTEGSIQVVGRNRHLTWILPSMVGSHTSEGVGAGGPNLWPGITTLIVPAVGGGGGAERVCSTDRAAEGVALTCYFSPHWIDHHWDWGNCKTVERTKLIGSFCLRYSLQKRKKKTTKHAEMKFTDNSNKV